MRRTLVAAIALLAGGCTGAAPVAEESGAPTTSTTATTANAPGPGTAAPPAAPASCPVDTTVLALVEDWNTAVEREPTEPDLSVVRDGVDTLVQQDADLTCRGAAELADAQLALDRVTTTTSAATPADWQGATTAIEVYLVTLGISPTVLDHPEVHTPPGFPGPPLETGTSATTQQP